LKKLFYKRNRLIMDVPVVVVKGPKRGDSFLTKYTMNIVGFSSFVATSILCSQKLDADSPAGEGLWITGLAATLITSVLTMLSSTCLCRPQHERRAEEAEMTWRQYIPHVAKSMLNPCTDNRRFYALGILISGCFAFPGGILSLKNFSPTALDVLEPIYYLSQFAALALPVKTEDAYFAWGWMKSIRSAIYLGIAASKPETFAPIIAADTIQLIGGLFAGLSGSYTSCTNRKSENNLGV
jgi:hypothetical protein